MARYHFLELGFILKNSQPFYSFCLEKQNKKQLKHKYNYSYAVFWNQKYIESKQILSILSLGTSDSNFRKSLFTIEMCWFQEISYSKPSNHLTFSLNPEPSSAIRPDFTCQMKHFGMRTRKL